jgi:PEP-CTERM motif
MKASAYSPIPQLNGRPVYRILRRSTGYIILLISFLPMKVTILLCTLILLFSQFSYADQVTPAFETMTITVEAPEPVRELIVKISNSKPFTCEAVETKQFGISGCVKTSDTTATIALTNTSNVTGKVTVGIKIKSPENDFKIVNAEWITEGGRTLDIPERQYDFKVTPVGDPQSLFTLRNDNSDAFLTFSGLRFLNNSTELPLDAPVGSLPGFVSFQSLFGIDTITLPPMTVSQSFLFPEIDPGNFLYIESAVFLSSPEGTPLSNTTEVRFGHQSPIPEPSTYLLLGTGLFWLLTFGQRRKSGKGKDT